MARTLADLFTPEEKARFDDTYNRGGITQTTAPLFAEDFASEIDDIAFRIQEIARIRQMPYSPSLARSPEALAEHLNQQEAELKERRSRAFDTALDVSFGTRSMSQLQNLQRAIMTGYADVRFKETLQERGPLGIAEDLAKSLITSVPRGIEATAKTLGGGFGRKPIERIGEMTGALLPIRAGLGLASTLARSAGRPTLAKALGKAVSHPISRGAAWTGEAADILGAEEDVYYEGLLEVLGEGTAEGLGAIGRGAKDAIAPTPEEDPTAAKQQQRAADNDAAAADRNQRINAGKIQAVLEIEASRLTALTQQVAAEKSELAPEDYAGIDDTTFVEALEGQVQHLQPVIAALEKLGLENAGEMLLATMLAKHQQDREAVAQQTIPIPETPEAAETATTAETPEQTPEQTAAADLAGQPQEQIDAAARKAKSAEEVRLEKIDADAAVSLQQLWRQKSNLAADDPQNQSIDSEIEKLSNEHGLRIVDITGATYDAGIAAKPLNIYGKEQFESNDELVIDRMIEPIIMKGTELQKTGSVIVKKKGETPDEQTTTESADTPDETATGTGEQTAATESTETPPEEPEVDWAGLEADIGSEVLETVEREGYTDITDAEPVVDTAISALIDDGTLTAADGETLKTTVIEQITPAIDELRGREEVPEARVGEEKIAYASDGTTEYRVRPVLRELDELVPSHTLQGNKRADYPEHLQPREGRGGQVSLDLARERAKNPNIRWMLQFYDNTRDGPPLTSKKHPRRSVSGSGRLLMYQIMRNEHPENWQQYQDALRTELDGVGIDEAEADAMTDPILTYELMDNVDEVEVARDANEDTTLDQTAAEQASQDTNYFDEDLMALWQQPNSDFAAALNAPENAEFRKILFDRIPTNLMSGFMTSDNTNFSADGIKRIQNAMIRYVFEGDLGSRLATLFIETELEGQRKSVATIILNALGPLTYAKARGAKIGDPLAAAIYRFMDIDRAASQMDTSMPIDERLYAGIENLLREITLVPTPLLEKQLLYLLYAKRRAYRQFVDVIDSWANRLIPMVDQSAGLFGATEDPDALSEQIFATAIRDHIQNTVFAFTENSTTGEKTWHTAEQMPYELKALRENLDQIPTTEGKVQAVSDWINAYLKFMNDSETQPEVEIPDATREPTAPDGDRELRADSAAPAGTGDDATGGEPTPSDTGTDTGDQRDDTTDDEQRRTDRDADSTPAGEESRTTRESIEESLKIVSVGTVSLDEWNASPTTGKRKFLDNQERAIPVHLRTGAINIVEADQKKKAIARLRQSIQETPSESQSISGDTTQSQRSESKVPPEERPTGADEPDIPETADANTIVGRSRRRTSSETPTGLPVAIQQALDTLGISTADWEHAKDNEQAEALLMSRQPFETPEQIDASVDLAGDIAGEMTIDEEEDYDFDDLNDVDTGRLRDISNEHRSDFDTVRRKVFLAQTITRLEAKPERTPIETAQLRALTATQRTDAQQKIYDRMLQAFVDQQVKRLEAKPSKSATETRILEALTAVQAEGIPEEASDRSLYADLETPDQEHSRPLSETRTLAGVNAPATAETDVNLPRSVTGDTTKLSPAQRTSIKAIIAAFKRKIHTDTNTTVQGGYLLGDKMGVGKTRQALATIWHYMRNGIERHFVFAPNHDLLNNYTTDMKNIGGPASDISNYHSGNPKPKTPIATATYSTLINTPNLTKFGTTEGNQNAVADIIEHLTGVRPDFMQTHPRQRQAMLEAFSRIGVPLRSGSTQKERVNNAVATLREQAKRLNLDNPEHVENFRERVTPALAEILISEQRGDPQQQRLFEGSNLHDAVIKLLDFAESHIYGTPDPAFEEAAEAFEGVIVFDEMHKGAGMNSQTGRMIDTLHQLLPNAKFLYMSATPFKEMENFFVASRLGLWGANQPFPTFGHFLRAFKGTERAVKEIIPLHLKQIGRYISRALSSKETRYTPTQVPMTDTEKEQYNTAVTFVNTLRQQFEAAITTAERTSWGNVLGLEDLMGAYKAHYMRGFYNSSQNFFLAILDAMKAQGLEENITQQLNNGDKIIVQLENTWEKATERAKARGQASAGPFDLLIDFVENEKLFPVHAYTHETRINRRGESYEAITPIKEYKDGKRVRVVDPQLKQIQTQFLESLKNEMQRNPLVGDLPFAADVIHQIAQDAGAATGEISGRRNTDREALSKAFSETTDVNLIVLGPAGLTGINLPITDTIKDKVGAFFHYLLQSSWNVNTFEQGLGRGKRANSAIDPHYMVVYQDLPGADRVMGATLAKFAEMGALAGQADNALMQNIDKVEGETSIDDDAEADVFEEQQGERSHVFGKHGQEALAQLWYDMYQTSDFEVADKLGLTHPEIAGDTGFIDPDTVPTVKEFFQRMLHQTTTDQPQIYEQFESRLKRIVTYKKELGQLDVGANNLNSQNGQITDRLTVYTDPDTGQTGEIVKLDVERQLPRRSWEFLQKVIRQEPGYGHHGGNRFIGVFQDVDGHVWAMFEYPFSERGTIEYMRWGPRGTPVQGLHEGTHRITSEELDNDFTLVADENESRLMNMEETQRLWETEDTDTDTYVDSEIFMATGLLLPKWQALSSGSRDAVMGIIPMADGSHLHGRVIPSNAVSNVLEQIGGVDPNYFDAQRRASRDETIADPNIDIPALVREIIGQQTDTQISARLNNIVEHIHQKLPLQLRGHLVRSPAEAALLGQLIRDPQTEHVWVVYRREGRILKIEPITLNKKGEADAGDIDHIKREIGDLGADDIMRIHNHPSGVAEWSEADKRVALQWHRELGTLMSEDIIVDSGTYGYRTFENGEYTWHENVPVNTDWNTSTTAVEDATGEIRPGDPLYENPLLRGARDAATYMYEIKRRTPEIAELIFVDSQTGKIVDTRTDAEIRLADDPAAHIKNLLSQRQGQHAHVMTWGDTNLAMALDGVENVDSVWVNDTRWTGVEHTVSVDRSITREVGGVEQAFVKTGDTLSDPKTPDPPILRKPVVIAGVQHELVPDTQRETLKGVYNRRGDAEHMVSENRHPLDMPELHSMAEERLKARGIEKPAYKHIDTPSYEHFRFEEFRKKYAEYAKGVLDFNDQQLSQRLRLIDKVQQRSPDDMKLLTEAMLYTRKLSPRLEKVLEKLTHNPKNNIRSGGYSFHGLLKHLTMTEKLEKEQELNKGNYEKHTEASREYNSIFNAEMNKVQDESALSEQDVYNRIGEEGVIRATHYSGDPEVNQGLLAYASYGPYYRRGEHTFGYILDLRKILKTIPGVTGTVHTRGTWGERRELANSAEIAVEMEKHKDSDPDTVIEIRIPKDLDINEYLVGVVDNNEVYVKKDAPPEWHTSEVQADLAGQPRGDNLLRDYQPSAEVPRANRAVRAMPPIERLNLQGEGKTRKWMSPQSQLFEKLRLWTPKLRKAKQILDNARRSGYGLLEELKASWDSDKPGPGDVIEHILNHRMLQSKALSGRTRSILSPSLRKLQQQVKRDGGQDADALRAAVDHDIINFIENNTPLRADFAKYQSIATELKESWRKVNQSYVEAMIKLMRDMAHREDIMKFGTRGQERWSPEPLGDLVWSWDVQDPNGESGAFISKDTAEALKNQEKTPGQTQMNLGQTEKTYTIAEAFAETDQLWYPHQYDRSRLRNYNRKIESLVKTLNQIAAQGDQVSDEVLAKAGIQRSGDGYLHGRLGILFDNLDAILKYYTNISDRTATLLKWYDDGTIGMYPHLERIRETHDRLYRRDTNLLMSTAALLWDRYAEINAFGQINPDGELPPRLATMLQTVELFNANERETALMAVIEGLHATKESRITAPDDEQWGMHESITAFESGERAAYDIMQMWEDSIIDDKGDKVKTGKWKGIDINRLNLNQQTLGALEQIGFIQPDGDGGFRVFGKTDAAQQKTIARFFVELMQTKASRKKKIQELVQSLGHWQQKDPLRKDSNELWKRVNTGVTFGALGWKQALQNLTEIPAVVMMAGTKSTMGMIRDMQDPDFRAAASELTEGLKHGIEFLADDNLQEKYLDSAWSMFGWTERMSRMLGVGVGLTHAKNLSRELLASQEGSKNRARIEREMQALEMNPEAILEMPADQLDTIFDEVIARIKSQELPLGGVELPSTPPAKNEHTDRMGEQWVRGAIFLSDTVFKPYDARTLPSVFSEAGPALKIILKFKGWTLQQNRFMVDQSKRAYQEARRYGNYRPLSNMLTSTLLLTGSVGAAQTLFSLAQGREEDDELLRAFLHTQTLGLSAILWEMALRSEGSPWRLEKSIEGLIVGPAWGTFADILSPIVTGDLDRTLQEVMQRTPITREAMYLGANRWWENDK